MHTTYSAKPPIDQPLMVAAQALAKAGYPVFPCKNTPDNEVTHKAPHWNEVDLANGYLSATLDQALITKWWTRWPNALIGVEKMLVVDIDKHPDRPDGHLTVPDWRDLSPVIIETPRGGHHLVFAWDDTIASGTHPDFPSIEVRAAGWYSIVPPSPGYRWLNGSDLTNLPPLPDRFRGWSGNRRPRSPGKARKKRNSPPASLLARIGDHRLQPQIVAEVEAWFAELKAAYAVIPNDDLPWDEWSKRGGALHAATYGSKAGLAIFDAWSAKSKKYHPDVVVERWQHWDQSPFTDLYPESIYYWAWEGAGDFWWRADNDNTLAEAEGPPTQPQDGVSLKDFVAYLPEHKFVFMPTGALWPASGVNARLPGIDTGRVDGEGNAIRIKPSTWLDENRRVELMTWFPGYPELIKDKLLTVEGAWTDKPGCTIYNLYRPPTVRPGDATKAGPWVDLVREVFPDDEEHIVNFLAHRRQHPEDKVNHMLVLGGPPGIGKDTIVTSAKAALGPWNVSEVSPIDVMGVWTWFLRSTVVLINELRDLGDSNRVAFYEKTKWMLASPPATLCVNEKHVKQYYIPNVCGVIGTTNHKTDGLYLPADDRRHRVAWSPLEKSHKTKEEWKRYHDWVRADGGAHIAAYLDAVDLTDFDPKAPPEKTAAFWQIVTASQQPEENELADVLATFDGRAVTLDMVTNRARSGKRYDLAEFLEDRTKRRVISVRMDRAGYVSVHNPDAKDGRWKVGGRDCVVYCPSGLSVAETYRRVDALIEEKRK